MSKASVKALRDALAKQTATLVANAQSAIAASAQELAGAIRSRAPIKSGNLARSVAAVALKSGGFRVQAGGDLTTREVRKGSGKPYDYARAVEFGTVNEKAHPFFYNTYRARKAGIKRKVKKAMTDAID